MYHYSVILLQQKLSMEPLLIYALDQNNKLIHVDSVPKGMACKCRCPNCNKYLQAKNNGAIRQHHFAHAHNESCHKAYETALHLLAKNILYKEKCLSFPDRGRIDFVSVELEKRYPEGDYIADAVCKTDDDKTIYVEFYVKHKVDKEKAKMIVENSLCCVEIDLGIQKLDEIALRKFLVNSCDNRKYIDADCYTPKNNIQGDYSFKSQNPMKEFVINYINEKFKMGLLSFNIKDSEWSRTRIIRLVDEQYDTFCINKEIGRFRSDLYICKNLDDGIAYSINVREKRRSKNQVLPEGIVVIDIIINDMTTEDVVRGNYYYGAIHLMKINDKLYNSIPNPFLTRKDDSIITPEDEIPF